LALAALLPSPRIVTPHQIDGTAPRKRATHRGS
jgi:hypothetical protein